MDKNTAAEHQLPLRKQYRSHLQAFAVAHHDEEYNEILYMLDQRKNAPYNFW